MDDVRHGAGGWTLVEYERCSVLGVFVYLHRTGRKLTLTRPLR